MAELHGAQQHGDGVSGALCGRLREDLLRGRQRPRRDRLCHGRRALGAGGERDLQLPPGPRLRAAQPLGPPGAEAQLAAHPKGKHLLMLCNHQLDLTYILLTYFFTIS